jgi:hypothetical protein
MKGSIATWVAMVVVMAMTAPAAHARSPVPIVPHEDMAIATGSGRTPSDEDVKKAIVAAAATTTYPWTVSAGEGGALVATTVVRGKHTVSVNIKYSGARYSVAYRDSTNMKYGVDKGVPKIHPFYNDWVQQLIDAINAELKKL